MDMNLEIERKFLVNSDQYKVQSFQKQYIKQGFLNSHEERTVRIRIVNGGGVLTIKGKSNPSGTTRYEWETGVSMEEAEALLLLCEPGVIEKNRYRVKVQEHIFEVDEFLGNNKGLVVAEVELKSEQDYFEKPTWIGEEVTGIVKYYNSQLSKHPYQQW